MLRSAISSFADKAKHRPTWLERNDDTLVEVRGFSPFDNLIYGAIVAAVILFPAIFLLVTTP